jgi:hypothetical protein
VFEALGFHQLRGRSTALEVYAVRRLGDGEREITRA